MTTRQVTSSDTEEQRDESVMTPDVSADVARGAPVQTSDAPDTATVALRDFVRALARAAARRDWEAEIKRLAQMEPTDDSQNNTSAQ